MKAKCYVVTNSRGCMTHPLRNISRSLGKSVLDDGRGLIEAWPSQFMARFFGEAFYGAKCRLFQCTGETGNFAAEWIWHCMSVHVESAMALVGCNRLSSSERLLCLASMVATVCHNPCYLSVCADIKFAAGKHGDWSEWLCEKSNKDKILQAKKSLERGSDSFRELGLLATEAMLSTWERTENEFSANNECRAAAFLLYNCIRFMPRLFFKRTSAVDFSRNLKIGVE